jgi:hypothetical protein
MLGLRLHIPITVKCEPISIAQSFASSTQSRVSSCFFAISVHSCAVKIMTSLTDAGPRRALPFLLEFGLCDGPLKVMDWPRFLGGSWG